MISEKGIFESIKSATNREMGLERNGFIPIDSDKIRGLTYAYKDGTMAIVAGKNGIITVDMDVADVFIGELVEIIDEFKEYKNRDIKTSLSYTEVRREVEYQNESN